MLKQVELAQVLVSLLLYMYESIKAVNLRTDEAQQRQNMVIFRLAVIWDQQISFFNLQNVLKTSNLRSFKEKHFLKIINRIQSLSVSLERILIILIHIYI